MKNFCLQHFTCDDPFYVFFFLVNQDKLLDKHVAEDSFGEQLQDTGRPVKSLLVDSLN